MNTLQLNGALPCRISGLALPHDLRFMMCSDDTQHASRLKQQQVIVSGLCCAGLGVHALMLKNKLYHMLTVRCGKAKQVAPLSVKPDL